MMQTALNGFVKFAGSAGIEDVNEIDANGDYLKPHGTRRGVGEVIYREHGTAAAQRVLWHVDPRTTSQMYAHIEASELAEETAEVLENE